MAASQRGVGPVVPQENDQGVFRDSEILQMVEDIPQGLVHALDERGVSTGGDSFALLGMTRGSVLVMGNEALVNLEGIVHGVVRQVQEERLLRGDGRIDLREGFQGQCFREESVGAVVFLQPGHGA